MNRRFEVCQMDASRPRPDGLLFDSERESLLELLFSGSTSDELDRHAKELLLARDAMTAWEARLRADGVRRFILGSHRIFDLLCQGETYEVLRGQNLFSGRVDVLKAMYRATNSIQRRARHLRKLHVQSLLHSPQFVAVYHVGYHGTNFAVVEPVCGGDLRALVQQQGPLPMAVAGTALSLAAEGIGEVHALGLAYSNIQPSKILFTGETKTKFCDAGEGQRLGTVCALPPPSGSFLDFASPEILRGDVVTPASDVYSLGCLLYYAVTAKVPFPGGTQDDKRRAHLNRFPVDPRRLAEGLDDEFVACMAAMMAKAPSERIQSPAAVIECLDRWVDTGSERGPASSE